MKNILKLTLASSIALTTIAPIGGNIADAETNTKEEVKKDQSKINDISFNKAQKMSPKEQMDELTKKDKELLNKDIDNSGSRESKYVDQRTPVMQQYAASTNINQYIANHNIKPAKIKEDSRIDNLPKYNYKSGKYVGFVVHDTANPNSTLQGEVNYMYNNWQNAFVHAYVDRKEIRQTAPADYLAWGSGPYGNAYFYQSETVHEHTLDGFARSVNNQAYLAAYELKRNGLKPKLASANGGYGTIYSHADISRYYGGTDHTDPIGYFSQWGYSMNQFYNLVVKHYNQMNGKSTSTTNTTSKSPIKGDTYKVVKGDTIYSISQRSGKSIKNIEKWNNIKNHSIKPGQTLKLKDKSNKITSKTYIVKSGDTLYNISKRSGVSINNIKKYNLLKSNTITKNQKLYLVPTHTVKKGETLYRIAKNNKTTVNKIKSLNGLKSNIIKVGQKLILK